MEEKMLTKNITSTENQLKEVSLILLVQEDNGSHDRESIEKKQIFSWK